MTFHSIIINYDLFSILNINRYSVEYIYINIYIYTNIYIYLLNNKLNNYYAILDYYRSRG